MENENQYNSTERQSNPYIIPFSILAAGVLIAGALIYAGDNSRTQTATLGNAAAPQPAPSAPQAGGSADNIKPVSAEDHIFGDPNAPVKLVEFSDLECPFCKRLHPTIQQLMNEYGKDGKVAWVYRHFPLTQLHSKAPKEAEATECANELGGNDKFWEYLDKLFEITPTNNGLDLAQLPQIAEDIGLNRSDFEVCLNSGKYADHVSGDTQDAIASGGQGTPYSVIIAPNGKTFPLSGAQPYRSITAIIELALKEN
jgi:protein-disulfide isomerase